MLSPLLTQQIHFNFYNLFIQLVALPAVKLKWGSWQTSVTGHSLELWSQLAIERSVSDLAGLSYLSHGYLSHGYRWGWPAPPMAPPWRIPEWLLSHFCAGRNQKPVLCQGTCKRLLIPGEDEGTKLDRETCQGNSVLVQDLYFRENNCVSFSRFYSWGQDSEV